MISKINVYLIEYAINSILRRKYKNLFIGATFSLLIFLLSSAFFITNSIKQELNSTLDSLPQILVQVVKGGRGYDVELSKVEEILSIDGVMDVVPRVWGYYRFENAGVSFTLVGVDEFETQYKESLSEVAKKMDFNSPSMYVGQGVQNVMRKNYYKDYFNFIKADGGVKKMVVAGVFDSETNLESNDVIVMSKENLREIFELSNENGHGFGGKGFQSRRDRHRGFKNRK